MKDNIKIQRIIIGALITLIVSSMIIGPVVILKSRANKKQINNYEEIEDIDDLPEEVQKIIKTTLPNDENLNTKKERNKQEIAEKEKIKTQIIEEIDNESITDEYKEYEKLSDEEKTKIEITPRKNKVDFENLDDIRDEIGYDENKIYPEKYNSLENSNISVSNQAPYGLCWNFAGTKVLEIYLNKTRNEVYNFSEIYTDYTASDLMFGDRTIHSGGDFGIFRQNSYIVGHVLEEKDEYEKNYTKDEYMSFLDKNQFTKITRTVSYPGINKKENSEEITSDEKIKEFRKTVKYHIMKYGALKASISMITGKNKKDVYCDGKDCYIDHDITIIGWDDNYPKENFERNDAELPKNNGAYLAQNSYGEDWGDNGRFYISYEDVFVEAQMDGIISTDINEQTAINMNNFSEPIREYLMKEYRFYIIDYEGEKYILKDKIESITSLDLNNKNINDNDLDSLKYFKNLITINLNNNNLTNIDVLAKRDRLAYISANNNNIKDVSALASLEKLNGIELDDNNGVSGYGKIKSLNSLSLINCNIENLENLNELENLEFLYLKDNSNLQIDFSMLPQEINTLNISNTNQNSLENLSANHKKIMQLDISNNPISKLDGIEELKILYSINISKTNITDLKILDELYDDEHNNPYQNFTVVMKDSDISDISMFNNIKVIEELNLEDNEIIDISNFDNENVIKLNLSGNKIKKGFESLINIRSLTLSNCDIDTLTDFPTMEKLQYLNLSNNNITDLGDIDKIKNIAELDLSYNKIIDLGIFKKFSNLWLLSLEGNKVTEGKLESDSISMLNIANSNIATSPRFSLSDLDSLYYINLSNNTITDFNKLIDTKTNSKNLTMVMENVVLNMNDIEYLKTNTQKEIRLSNAIIDYHISIKESIETELDSQIRQMLIKGKEFSDNTNVKMDKFYKTINVNDISEKYEFHVEKIPEDCIYEITVRLNFDNNDQHETAYRKTEKETLINKIIRSIKERLNN